MIASDYIAITSLVVTGGFSAWATWQAHQAKADAAAANARADEAMEISRRQAEALEAQSAAQADLTTSVRAMGKQPVDWEIQVGNGTSDYYLYNAGTKRSDGVWISGADPARKLPDHITLEPGTAHKFLMFRPPENIVVYCDAEPDGRGVRVPVRR